MQTFLDSVPPAKIVHVRFYGQEVDNTGARQSEEGHRAQFRQVGGQ